MITATPREEALGAVPQSLLPAVPGTERAAQFPKGAAPGLARWVQEETTVPERLHFPVPEVPRAADCKRRRTEPPVRGPVVRV